MGYLAELQAGHWLIIAGCIMTIIGSVGLGMKAKGK